MEFDHLSNLQATADEIVIWRDQSGPFTISRVAGSTNSHFRLRLGDLSVIDVLDDRRFTVYSDPSASGETHEHFLADQAIPRSMVHAGFFILHSGAVQVDQRAILILGPSGRGKSTLVTSFDQAGFPLMGDDAIAIIGNNEGALARPVYPSLRLMPDSIEALLPESTWTAPVAPYTTKRRIDLKGGDHAGHSKLPIAAIFVIAPPPPAKETLLRRRLSIAESCMALVENSFALDPSDTSRAKDRLRDASALARAVPAFEISYPRDYARLPEVRQAILDQVAELDPA